MRREFLTKAKMAIGGIKEFWNVQVFANDERIRRGDTTNPYMFAVSRSKPAWSCELVVMQTANLLNGLAGDFVHRH